MLLSVPPVRACSVCGCTLDLDWSAQGLTESPGITATLRTEYFSQDRLYHGTSPVNRADLDFPNDQEIQRRTLNRNAWLDVDYATAAWDFRLQLPWHDRFHTTVGAGDTETSSSQADGLGDLRVLARTQATEDRRGGLQLGLKLPTGGYRQRFSAGPQSGLPLDRGLQLGTGTCDLLVGACWFGHPSERIGTFIQADLDQPLDARAGFLPPASLSASGGLRWESSSRLTPELQLNVRWESREHGPESDRDNSGGLRAHLSPGATLRLGAAAQAFAFVQLPVFRHLNGLQLEPRSILSLGLQYHL